MSQTILVADDEKEIRELLRLYLEKEGYTVIQAENGAAALEKASASPIDLAVVDVMMPRLDGYQLIKALRGRGSLPIIVVSAKTENHEKILGLDLGADDYVTKPFDPMEVVARIRAQLRRSGSSDAGVLRFASLRLDLAACALFSGSEAIPLTATELGIMKLFLESPGRVFTKQQIYLSAWPEAVIPDDNAVMVAMSRLRGKLPSGSGAVIGTVRGLGYRLEARK